MTELVTTCAKCGASYRWNNDFQTYPDCPRCGYNAQKEYLQKREHVIDAIKQGDLATVKRLLQPYDMNQFINMGGPDAWTYLHHAVVADQLEVAKLLLQYRVDPNRSFPGSGNDTPLHLAVKQSYYEMAKQLIDYGANVRQKNDTRYTPLDVAREFKDDRMVTLLTDYKPSPPGHKDFMEHELETYEEHEKRTRKKPWWQFWR